MDSRLLNVLYDDPFDGNYVRYDDESDFWSSGRELMAMQLTETLNGILPIAPTEAFHEDENVNVLNIQNNMNAFTYEDFAVQHLTTGRAIEMVKIGTKTDGYDTDSEDSNESDASYEDDGDNNDLLDFERQSQCTNATFRSRTDSSSIGDYESHTSDYDDSDSENDDNKDDNDNDYQNNILDNSVIQNSISCMVNNSNNSILNLDKNLTASTPPINRTHSTKCITSEVDALGLQIDSHNFDLAEFITKDDFQFINTSNGSNAIYRATINVEQNKFPKCIGENTSIGQVIKSQNNDSDADSDVIVDVETVEIDEDDASCLKRASRILNTSFIKQQIEEDMTFVDNVKLDPSWSPNLIERKNENYKNEEKPSAQKPTFTRNFPLVANKKQYNLLKGKFANSKAKSTHGPTKATTATTATTAKNRKIENSPIKQVCRTDIVPKKIGIGIGSKNLAILKHERDSISAQTFENNKSPKKHDTTDCRAKLQNVQIVNEKIDNETTAHKDARRKLNLDEYKKRRGVENIATTSTESPKLDNKTNDLHSKNEIKVTANTPPTKHSDAVTSIVKTLKEEQKLPGKIPSDPITEAKNKVLRMQQFRRAQQMRIIDSKISSKVPRVTKVLPLKEIVKDSPYLNEKLHNSCHSKSTKSEYEEIIIVSTSCNTDISIPPVLDPATTPVNNATRSLLKSTALLSTISNTVQKVKAADNAKLSSNSLISSIHDVVVMKTLPIETVMTEDVKGDKNPEHHGEDKIIMHLRKDRIRNLKCSIGTQTDLQPEFNPLAWAKASMQHISRERTRRYRRRRYRQRHGITSSSSENSSGDDSGNRDSSTISRSRDNSYSSSLERTRTYDSAIGTGGYSSRSSVKYRSSISSSYSESAGLKTQTRRQRRTSYTKRSAARKRSRSPYSSSSYTSESDRSRSPPYQRSRSRSKTPIASRSRRSSYRQVQNTNSFVDRNVPQPAVEERRIVYVGRIEQETTKEMLRRKFLQYGTIKHISIHFKDTGMKYGFVTFQRSQDAFAAIDNSTRDPQISMYDVSFGGRRAFCRSSYADLDNAGINTYQSYVFPQAVQQPEDSFQTLLMKMKAKLNANKTTTTTDGGETATKYEKHNGNNKI